MNTWYQNVYSSGVEADRYLCHPQVIHPSWTPVWEEVPQCRTQKITKPPSLWVFTTHSPFSNSTWGVSKSFRTGRLERELQTVQLSATRCSWVAILWASLVSFAAINLRVASQRVIPKVSVYFVIDSVRKFWLHSRTDLLFASLYPIGIGGEAFSGCKVAWSWSWPLTSI
jgi:hypothetical protein